MKIDVSFWIMIGIAISLCAYFPIYALGMAAITNSTTAPPEEIGTTGASPEEVGGQSGEYSPDISEFSQKCHSNISSINPTNRTLAGNTDNIGEFGGSNTADSRFILNSVPISKDLSGLSPSVIKDYRGLPGLPTVEIYSVLCMLSPGNLTKVLMNIPFTDLQVIKAKLEPKVFEGILSNLPELDRSQILSRAK